MRNEMERAIRTFPRDYLHCVRGEEGLEDNEDQNEEMKSKNCKIRANALAVMQKYLISNFHAPYPSIEAKKEMAIQSGLNTSKINNWFINARERTMKKCFEQSTQDKKKKNQKDKRLEGELDEEEEHFY